MSADQISPFVHALWKKAGVVPDQHELGVYAAHLAKFDVTWRSARDVLGDDARYADSLHAAGLLCRMNRPLVSGTALVGFETLYALAG